MKVAVVSLYGRNNYGNCLQRHAVHALLEQNGCNPTSLDRRRLTKDLLKERLIEVLSILPIPSIKLERARRFLAFDSHIVTESVSHGELKRLIGKYDAFVAGSDQVWNPRVWDFDAEYNLLGFVEPSERRIALSPSFGVSQLDSNDIGLFQRYLIGYCRLSVREREGAEIVRRQLGQEAEVLPDPTMALSSAHWQAVADHSLAPSSPYVVVYELGSGRSCVEAAERYAQPRGLSVVELNNASNRYFAAGPADFIGLIFGAEAVFTDSFHAMVFSLLGHTPFKVLPRGGSAYSMSSRISTLEAIFGIASDDPEQDYDWDAVDKRQTDLSALLNGYLTSELKRVSEVCS